MVRSGLYKTGGRTYLMQSTCRVRSDRSLSYPCGTLGTICYSYHRLCTVQGQDTSVREASSKGSSSKRRIVQRTNRLRHASSKDHRPGHSSSKRRIVQGKHRPRDASSKVNIVQETHRPRYALSKGFIVQGTHRPRDSRSRDSHPRDA
jgi:hypothetical protein